MFEKVDGFEIIGFILFILLFLYFWWQRYQNVEFGIADLSSVTPYILIDVLIHSFIVWIVLFAVLYVHNIMKQNDDSEDMYNPEHLLFAFYFFFSTFIAAVVCQSITSLYLSYCVDNERLETDKGFAYVVIKCAMFANLCLFFVVFYILKPKMMRKI